MKNKKLTIISFLMIIMCSFAAHAKFNYKEDADSFWLIDDRQVPFGLYREDNSTISLSFFFISQVDHAKNIEYQIDDIPVKQIEISDKNVIFTTERKDGYTYTVDFQKDRNSDYFPVVYSVVRCYDQDGSEIFNQQGLPNLCGGVVASFIGKTTDEKKVFSPGSRSFGDLKKWVENRFKSSLIVKK